MFFYLNNITKISINFGFSNITNMEGMFHGCSSLVSLDLNNCNTSSVTDMNHLFTGCSSLISLDLNKFVTSSVDNMASMFEGCSSLTSLNLNNFVTSSVTNMDWMFHGCSALISLNLNNFDTSSVTNMSKMFFECNSLISLDFYNLNTFSVKYMELFFYNCNSLIILNLNNSNLSNLPNDIFGELKNNNLTLCINELKLNQTLSNYSTNFVNNCPYIELINKEYKIIIQKKMFIANCSTDDIYKFEYNKICYESCPKRISKQIYNSSLCQDLNCTIYNFNQTECINNIPQGYFLNDSFLRTIDKCDDDCETCNNTKILNNSNCNSCKNNSKYLYFGNCISDCPNGFSPIFKNNSKICYKKCNNDSEESLSHNLCISCNKENNFYPKNNDSSNNNSYLDCYNNLEGYYLDNEMFYKCYKTCENCNLPGNETHNNCVKCKLNYTFLKDENNNYNCYKQCKYYYYFNSSNEYICTDKNECPDTFSKLIREKNKCIDDCNNDDTYKFEYNNTCYNNSYNDSSFTDINSYYLNYSNSTFINNNSNNLGYIDSTFVENNSNNLGYIDSTFVENNSNILNNTDSYTNDEIINNFSYTNSYNKNNDYISEKSELFEVNNSI